MSITCGDLLEEARKSALTLPSIGAVATSYMMQHLVNKEVTPALHSNGRCEEITASLLGKNPGLFDQGKLNSLLREI